MAGKWLKGSETESVVCVFVTGSLGVPGIVPFPCS